MGHTLKWPSMVWTYNKLYVIHVIVHVGIFFLYIHWSLKTGFRTRRGKKVGGIHVYDTVLFEHNNKS